MVFVDDEEGVVNVVFMTAVILEMSGDLVLMWTLDGCCFTLHSTKRSAVSMRISLLPRQVCLERRVREGILMNLKGPVTVLHLSLSAKVPA